jgi:hypothetical protein
VQCAVCSGVPYEHLISSYFSFLFASPSGSGLILIRDTPIVDHGCVYSAYRLKKGLGISYGA